MNRTLRFARRTLPLFALALVFLGSGSAHAATLTLSPNTGPAGTSVTAKGTGFPKRAEVTIRVGTKTLASGFTANRNRRFSQSFAWPSGFPDGAQTVTASTTSGTTSASATYTVTGNTPPPADSDGDGVPDSSDQCPTQPGPAPSGCPTPPPPSGCTSPPCFDWIGNTFSGRNYNHVPEKADDLAVSGDGWAVTGADWVESAHNVRIYNPSSGAALGPRTRDHGGGAIGGPLRSVDVDGQYIYATAGLGISRWDRSTFINWPAPSDGAPSPYDARRLTIRSGSGYLLGIAKCGSELYVADSNGDVADNGQTAPTTTQIRAVNADLTGGVKRSWSAPRARHLSCDREGNIWALMQRTSTSSARLVRYSPTGTQLAAFDVPGNPQDLAADPTTDQVWITNNAQAQDVERYTYGGALADTFGTSYLSGPTPGLLGPKRFAGPDGIALDNAGNIYVTQTSQPGSGDRGWLTDYNGPMTLSKFAPDGSQVWRDESAGLGGTAAESTDGTRLYTTWFTYEKGADGRWHERSLNRDPWAYPNDYRNTFQYGQTPQVRDVGGTRLVATFDEGGPIRFWREQGEILVPSTVVGTDPDFIDVPGQARQTPSGLPSGDAVDVWLMPNGDIWRIGGDGGGVWRYRLTGQTANGDPIYSYSAVDTYPFPAGFVTGKRIEVHGSNVYVSGWNAQDKATYDGVDVEFRVWAGRRIVKYASLPTSAGWPTPAWNKPFEHWGCGSDINGSRDKPRGWTVAGNEIAVAYQTSQTCVGDPLDNRGYFRFLSTATGAETRHIFSPSNFGWTGWFDMDRPLTYSNGHIYAEEDHLAKMIEIEVVEATPPNTNIASGPPAFTKNDTPTFAFSSTEANASFQCRIGSSAWAACTSPRKMAALSNGYYNFYVRAIDKANNVDATPASRGFTVDTVAPKTRVTMGPSGKTTDRTPTIKFRSSDAGSKFKCKLDHSKFTTCDSPKTYKKLHRGKHTFSVQATDRAGNADSSPARRTFKIVRR